MAQGQLILVVDDQKGMRLLFEEVLTHYGYRVATASNGAEALAIVAENQPDLVLLDMRMPGLSGPETLHELRADYPTLPVIMVTAETDDVNWPRVEKLGVQGKLNKPFNLEDLVNAVAKVLA